MRGSCVECAHAVRLKMVRGVEDEEWQKLAEKIKGAADKKREKGDEEQRKVGGEEVQVEEKSECDEVEYGERKVKKVHDPKLPTEEEVRDHYLSGHMPYRSWCHHCVRGQGRERDRTKKREGDQEGIP